MSDEHKKEIPIIDSELELKIAATCYREFLLEQTKSRRSTGPADFLAWLVKKRDQLRSEE